MARVHRTGHTDASAAGSARTFSPVAETERVAPALMRALTMWASLLEAAEPRTVPNWHGPEERRDSLWHRADRAHTAVRAKFCVGMTHLRY